MRVQDKLFELTHEGPGAGKEVREEDCGWEVLALSQIPEEQKLAW